MPEKPLTVIAQKATDEQSNREKRAEGGWGNVRGKRREKKERERVPLLRNIYEMQREHQL